jgi:alkaline phosphatase D
MQISRRSFLVSTTAMGATPFVRLDAQSSTARRVFRHGVASGDPLTDRVILWTRVTSVRAAPGSAGKSRVMPRSHGRSRAA